MYEVITPIDGINYPAAIRRTELFDFFFTENSIVGKRCLNALAKISFALGTMSVVDFLSSPLENSVLGEAN